ncbi:MAG: GGDEF domain-containing protein [bacterium]
MHSENPHNPHSVLSRNARLKQQNEYLRKANAELQKKLAEVTSLHHRDPLTGAYSRAYALERIKELENSRSVVGVIFVDMNDLKPVNDTPGLGHSVGDECLKSAARLLTQAIRSNDTLARYGGDEYIILLSRATDDAIAQIEKRIESLFAEYFSLNGLLISTIAEVLPDWRFSVSFGSGIRKEGDTRTILEMVNEADAKMYLNKEARKASRTR